LVTQRDQELKTLQKEKDDLETSVVEFEVSPIKEDTQLIKENKAL
jgi:hypothetical protein